MRFALAVLVALSVASLAHAQASAKVNAPQSCAWSSSEIPNIQPSPQRVIVAPAVAATALIHRIEPQYPADASLEGTMVLCAIIAKDGTIESLAYVSGPALLIKAVFDAVKGWQYKPTLVDGKPVEVETKIFVDLKRPAKGKQSGSETDTAATTK